MPPARMGSSNRCAFGFANMSSGNTRNIFRMIRQLVTVPLFTPTGLMDKNRSVAGVNLGHLWDDPFLPVAMNRLLILYREGQIKPHRALILRRCRR